MKLRPLALIPIILVVLVGLIVYGSCHPNFEFHGKWKGNRQIKARPGENPYLFHTVGNVVLTIEDNNDFTLIEGGVPTGGYVQYLDGKGYLHTKTFMERPISAQGADADKMHPLIVLTPQADGTLLFDDPMAVDGKKLTLKRDLQPKK